MKKRWKIFWITCAVLGILGIGFCMTGLTMGVTLRDIEKVSINVGGDFQEDEDWDDWDDEDWYGWDDEDDWDDFEEEDLQQAAVTESESATENIHYYDPVKELELKVKRAKIEIQEYDGDKICVDRNKLNEDLTVSSSIKDGKLLISVKGDSEDNEGTLLIKLPKDTAFESLELDLYGGILQVTKIQALDLDLSASAGLIQLSDFQADNMDIECGAGEIRISGRVTQDADIECGVGTVSATLLGKETDYDYNLSCGIGDIKVANDSYSGIGREMELNNGQGKSIQVDCGVGSVNLQFADSL